MKKLISLFCVIFFSMTHSFLSADCQNCNYYNGAPGNGVPFFNSEGYYEGQGCDRPCPQPGCYPSAPTCGMCCGVTPCAIAFSIALIAGVAILIVTVSQDSSTIHAPNL